MEQKQKKPEYQTVAIDSLKMDPANVRKHPDKNIESIVASLDRFGQQKPIVVDKKGFVRAGNGTLEAAKLLHWKTIDVVVSDLDKSELTAYAIADNRTQETSEWDMDGLTEQLKSLDYELRDVAFPDFKFPDDPIEGNIDDDQVPDTNENEFDVRPGDIWILGNHRLMCGDSTNVQHVDKLMDGKKADMVFTDPPYELKTDGGGIRNNIIKKQLDEIKSKVDSFDPSCLSLYAKINIFFHNKPLIKKYIELAENNGVGYDLGVYKKENPIPNFKGHLMTDLEYIAMIGNLNPNQGLDREYYSKSFIGKKDQDNKLSYSKPVAICEKYIKLYSKKSVLDLFLGSGSTLIACEKTNRTCYGMELDPHYCSVIIKRWQEFTGREAQREEEK